MQGIKVDSDSLGTVESEMIGDILGREKYQPTTQCVQEFKDFALEKRVHAELFFNSSFNPDIVEIKARDGVVGLTGGKAFEATRASLADHISSIRGVTKVITDAGEVELTRGSGRFFVTRTCADGAITIAADAPGLESAGLSFS